jgi:protein arginine N-methyltransferase 1
MRDLLLRGVSRFNDKLISIPFVKHVIKQQYFRIKDIKRKTYFSNLFMHENMLADRTRVESYFTAIIKYVHEGDIVVDAGTGSGILSFFAHLKHPRKIYAIDDSDILEIAKIVADKNGMSDISFFKGSSQSFTIPEKADVIIQEQMGAWLFNGNMVDSVIDLRDRILKKGGKILPNSFELFIEPVKMKDDYLVPFIWEQNIHNIDFQCLKKKKGEMAKEHFYRTIKPYEVECFLSVPAPILSFNLETISSLKDLPSVLKSHKIVVKNERLDGFCLYFRAIFDEDIILDKSPLRTESSHSCWENPIYRAEAEQIQKGDVIELTFSIDDYNDIATWSWDYKIR